MRAIIDGGAEVFTLINTFTVVPDRQNAVIASLRSFTDEHARLLPGFIAAAVHASADGRRVINYVQWKCKADLGAMMATAAAQAHVTEVGALAEHVDPVVYRVVFVGSNALAGR